MEEYNLLKKLGRVEAPHDFRQKVLTELSLRTGKHVKVKHFRLSFAGAFGTLAIFFMVFNFFILPHKKPGEYYGLDKETSSSLFQETRGTIPIIESVDYYGEMRNSTREPATIYILEQVSDGTDTKIKF